MAFLIIDRRLNGKHKSVVNRQRFLRRYSKHIKEAVADAIIKRSITDIERGDSISIPRKDISEPVFRHSQRGRQTRVFPGNRDFITGDRIRRPAGGTTGSGQGGAGDSSDSEDDFIFELTQEEFMEFMFEGLELPNLIKKQLVDTTSFTRVKGGYTKVGIPARLNVLQSLRSAQARRIALSGSTRQQIKTLKRELQALEALAENDQKNGLQEESSKRMLEIKRELERLKNRLSVIPFLDDFDLKYNNIIKLPTPSTSAVMFCLMDVSGSMTQDIKDMAKRFFILLYLFLKRNYQKIDVIFIRHHTSASEVDEDTFFYSRQTGGTLVSSALKLMDEIIHERYPAENWNIYAAQASDGDNWTDDSHVCRGLLIKRIMPLLQYYTYVEITSRNHQALWYAYKDVIERFPESFAMKQIVTLEDIYPVFHRLFEKRTTT